MRRTLKELQSESRVRQIGTFVAFAAAMVVYCLTVDPSASWWDCPEYLVNAYRLEVGHSPGNPTWALAANIIARPVAALFGVEKVALAINLSSALFTALAVALLFQIAYIVICRSMSNTQAGRPWLAGVASLIASLIFAWSDSPWFSAVETEVYAMSLFFTAITLRLMLAWAYAPRGPASYRRLILIAYLTGLSIGVHELNLLVIPAFSLIFIFKRYPRHATGKAWIALALSIVIMGSILMCMYPGLPTIAGEFELLAVNTFGFPFNSGVIIFLCLLLLLGVASPLLIARPSASWAGKVVRSIVVFLFFAMSGYLLPGRHFIISILLCVAATWFTMRRSRIHPGATSTMLWMAGFCILGFSTYLLIPIRAAANPPVNENAPTDVFSFLGYLKRDQYGSKPLFYGPTPYAKPMLLEEKDTAGKAIYAHLARIPERPHYQPALPGAKLSRRTGLVTGSDSVANAQALAAAHQGAQRYVLSDYRHRLVYTPELNMLLPRLTSHKDIDIRNYESWAGMKKENMDTIRVSYALDSAWQPVGRLGSDGSRSKELSYRPTYLQHLQELFGYQIGYMYFRYLLWNYAGRQNDYPSAGEVEHGNIITGISPFDNFVLGDQDMLPPELGSENAGRNPYYCLPLIIGILGIVGLMRFGREGPRSNAWILTLFLMTGVAIVVYLNQDPGEPRERDYSFMGSFFAFAIWIAVGCAWLLKLVSHRGKVATAVMTLLLACVPAMMLAVNYADHDRSRRSGPTDYALNVLNSLDPEAIIFVEGDNYTFPLWYAQEVLGVRRDVTIVNLAYLTTNWYPLQLKIGGEQSKPLPLTADAPALAYGNFAFVKVPEAGSSASAPRDAVEMLRELYTSDDVTPRFASSHVRIPSPAGDSITMSMLDISGGKRNLGSRELVMFDIIATNASSPRARPVYWHQAIIPAQMVGMEPYTSRTLYTRKYNPGAPGGFLIDESLAMLPTLRYGGADRSIYADPYVGDQISRQRLSLMRLADVLEKEGRHEEALKVALIVADRFPDKVWPYQAMIAYDGEVWQEGIKLGSLLRDNGKATGDRKAVARGDSMVKAQQLRLRRWRRWYHTLTPWQRTTLSAETRRLLRHQEE